MASGDNVDIIEVVETSFRGPEPGQDLSSRLDDSGDEDDKSTGEKTSQFDSLTTQHGIGGSKTPSGVGRNKSERERKIGHRRVGVGGEITYKKIQSTQIMGSIQLGIQHAVGGLASKPERDLLMQDFMTVETTNFPSEGSNHTPAHHFSEFKFKNYAPIAFRYFRDLFGIQPDDFLMSMCSSPLRELSNPGASGSIFYLTEDDEFIIKTVQHKEGEFLQTLLPGYYMNLNQNPRTLLPKFFGLYCYRCNSKNVRLIAMNNLLPSAVKLHQKYDLKGSTYKRKASRSERSKKSPTYKDLDFMEHHPEGIFLEADTYGALVKTILRDCRVLESFKIMDYSLLVGIHNLDQAAREKTEQKLPNTIEEEPGEAGYESGNFVQVEREKEREDRIGAVALNRSRSINRQRLVAHSTAMESIQAESEPIDEEDDVPPGGIPARNARGERLLLFLGIIDILQSYRLKKKLEHTWKSMIHDGDTVSVHRPGFYAQRFQDFMAKTVFKKIPSPLKHSPSKRKSISRPLRSLEGDFDSTVVAATGSTTMHATSPTKPGEGASPTITGVSTLCTNTMPIATSTPVNLPTAAIATTSDGAANVSPPPLIVNSTVRASYPAVLKGRTAASPPVANLVPSGKVPPPVPPRGTAKRTDEHHIGNVSFSTAGRGDVNLPRSLHDDGSEIVMKILQKDNYKNPPRSSLHAPLPFHHVSFDDYLHDINHLNYYKNKYYTGSINDIPLYHYELDEFVSVEKVDNNYIIRTSPYPFRPNRKKKRSLPPLQSNTNESIGNELRPIMSHSTETVQKSVQLLNPLLENNGPNKMSRKDKKYSNTYAECQREKNKNSMKLKKNSPRKIIKPMNLINSDNDNWEIYSNKLNPNKVKMEPYKIKKKKKYIAPVPWFEQKVFHTLSNVTQKSIQRPVVRLSSINTKVSRKKIEIPTTMNYKITSDSDINIKYLSTNIYNDTKKYSENLNANQHEIHLNKQTYHDNIVNVASTSRNTSFLHSYKFKQT